MSRRDIELITALAEGSLADETEARALIERSPRLRAIYEEQRRALDSLASITPATMSESEKAALRRDVWTAFTTAPEVPAKAPRAPWAWGYAAVFLFGLVGLVAVLNNSGALDAAAESFVSSPGEATNDQTGRPPAVSGPDTEEHLESELFAVWATSARDGTRHFADAATLESHNASNFRLATCEADIALDEDLQNYEVLQFLELEGSRYVIGFLHTDMALADPDADPEVVIVDLDECEIAYRD